MTLIKRWGASVATTFKISDNTSIRFDAEVFQAVLPQFSENLIDHYSQWDHTTASQTWGAAPTGGTASSQSMAEWGGPASFQLWIPSEGTLMNWGAGFGRHGSGGWSLLLHRGFEAGLISTRGYRQGRSGSSRS